MVTTSKVMHPCSNAYISQTAYDNSSKCQNGLEADSLVHMKGRRKTHWIWLNWRAAWSGSATGSVVARLASAPCCRSILTQSVWPSWLAKNSGDAPSSAHVFTTSNWPTIQKQSTEHYLWLIDWLSMVLRLHQHNIGYTADGFYRSDDPTDSVKALKEGG